MNSWPPLDFEQRQRVRTNVAQGLLKYSKRAFETFSREMAHAVSRRYFWDLPPRERRAIYAQHPPQEMDGTIPGALPDVDPMTGQVLPPVWGEYNWLWMAQKLPAHYQRHLEDYGTLMKEQVRKLEKEAEAQYEEMA